MSSTQRYLTLIGFLLFTLGLVPVFSYRGNQQKTDRLGNIYYFGHQGHLTGHQMGAFSNSFQMQLNNQHVSLRYSSSDKFGDLFSGQALGLTINRLVFLDDQAGFLRYIEIFENNKGSNIQATLRLNFQMGSQASIVQTDSGALFSNKLDKKDRGLMIRQNNQNFPILFWMLKGKNKSPNLRVTNSNRYTFMAEYLLDIKPKEKVAVVHVMAMRSSLNHSDKRALKKLYKTLDPDRVIKKVPKKLYTRLANVGRSMGDASGESPELLLKNIENERGPVDILVYGKSTKLHGDARLEPFQLQTAMGDIQVRNQDLAALIRSESGRMKFVLRDGQVYQGPTLKQKLGFQMSNGSYLSIPMKSVDRLYFKILQDDQKGMNQDKTYLMMRDGSQLVLDHIQQLTFHVMTPWGPLSIQAKDISNFQQGEIENAPVLRMVLKNGSNFPFFWNSTTLTVPTKSFGEKTLNCSDIIAMTTDTPSTSPQTNDQDSWLLLKHETKLKGEFLEQEMPLLVNDIQIPIALQQIKTMLLENDEGQNARAFFNIELWGGDQVRGVAPPVSLQVKVGQQGLRVPLAHILELNRAHPKLPIALRQRIQRLIQQLGHENWTERERATRELKNIGEAAKALLLDAERTTLDEEIRYRARLLIDSE